MKKTIIALALAASSLPALAQKAPEPDYTLSANVGLFSDYRFRGLSQTGTKPALQGGFDFAHKSGLYAGNWNSSINWVEEGGYTTGNSSGLESDFYVGYKTELGGIGVDVGNLFYYFAGEGVDSLVDTNEIYLGLSYGPFSLKTSYTTSSGYFSTAGKGTIYYNLSASFPVSETVALKASYGYTGGKEDMADFKGTDYSVGVAIDLGDGWGLGLSYVGAAGDYKEFAVDGAQSDSAKSAAVVSISRSF